MGASFFICLALVLLIGLSSARQAKASAADYFVASRSVPPWLVGLSAVATNNSGYMFIGLIGYTYAVGIQSVWLMVGWIAGDLIGSKVAHERMRDEAERVHANGIISLLARWGDTRNRSWQVLAALVSVAFLSTYAAAQISAGGKALEGMLDIPMAIGMGMVALVVIAYSIAGGMRASIWTDAVQSLLMVVSMVVLLLAAVNHLGGLQAVFQQAGAIDGFLNPSPTNLDVPGFIGPLAFVVGWMFAGAAALGQPHIVSRFLALQNTRQMNQVRWWYYSYYLLFYSFATAVGLLSRLYFGESTGFDPEMALPNMARDLLPPWLAGLMLAGIFAATMSTADSLVLSCSSALTQDLPRNPSENRWLLKAATGFTTLFALGIGLWSEQSVFSLVVWAWGTLGAAFVPILIWQVLGAKLNSLAMLCMSSTGVMATVAWKFYGFPSTVYEGAVGMFSAFVLGAIFTISSIRSRFHP
ncbi:MULTISPECIES: sodium/proline symporter [unclassified Limnobacter]|uniref:sodium/proline symporter n=1 Tax=unclassified Limnobacter TaxID=2630203 RepID=UPI000C69C722|nr:MULTISPECIES: sodium/proline symporter [unclassified Limnobacter]MAZ08985.1 sodium:proline symporter [Sutterellaceae bacterium]